MATTLAHKIKDDYGTLTRFCRLHNINRNTFNVVLNGYGSSNTITSLLVEKGYIKEPSDIKRKSA